MISSVPLAISQVLANSERPLILFSMTPPRTTVDHDGLARVARLTQERLADLDLDALILYDISDESDRNATERPFPYLETVDPGEFHEKFLADWKIPTIIYRAVGKYHHAELRDWFAHQDQDRIATVLVGASSSGAAVQTTLAQAQDLRRQVAPSLTMGSVAIPERHSLTHTEHHRMLAKQQAGSTFFVSQVIYDVDAAKDLISDYHYLCLDEQVKPAPMIFTLSVCGSRKTLAFLEWLGVRLPRWMFNELERTSDPLTESYHQCHRIAVELAAFCARLGMPYGFNVESVSNRRVEIETSVTLATVLARDVRAAPAGLS